MSAAPSTPERPPATAANAALLLGIAGVLSLLAIAETPSTSLPIVIGLAAAALGLFVLGRACLRRRNRCGIYRATVGIGLGVFTAVETRPLARTILYLQVLPICSSNLRSIGMCLRGYAQQHGTFPPDWQALLAEGWITPRSYTCPMSGSNDDTQPDYFYVAGLAPIDPADWIIVYDPPTHHARGEGFVLYVNGEVTTFRGQSFTDELARFSGAYQPARGHAPTSMGRSTPARPPQPTTSQTTSRSVE